MIWQMKFKESSTVDLRREVRALKSHYPTDYCVICCCHEPDEAQLAGLSGCIVLGQAALRHLLSPFGTTYLLRQLDNKASKSLVVKGGGVAGAHTPDKRSRDDGFDGAAT